MLKTRLFGLALVILFAGMIYYGWYQLREEGVYYMKMAAFSPLGVVGGIFLMLFPNMGGKPDTTKRADTEPVDIEFIPSEAVADAARVGVVVVVPALAERQ